MNVYSFIAVTVLFVFATAQYKQPVYLFFMNIATMPTGVFDLIAKAIYLLAIVLIVRAFFGIGKEE